MTAAHGPGVGAAVAISRADLNLGVSRWGDAVAAAELVAIDPLGLRGAVVIAGPGAARDLWLDYFMQALPVGAPVRRLPFGIADDRLLGGVDLIRTLEAGRAVIQRGVLAEADGGVIVVPTAERLSPATAARIAAALDQHEITIEREGVAARLPTRIGVVVLDERASPEECAPAVLLERLAFHVDLTDIAGRLSGISPDRVAIERARNRLAHVEPASDALLGALVSTAAAYGVASMTTLLLTLRAARAAAARDGRSDVTSEDGLLAARLVIAPRARVLPGDADLAGDGEPSVDREPDGPHRTDDSGQPSADGNRSQSGAEISSDQASVEDILLAAVRAALPEGLLPSVRRDAVANGTQSRGHGSGALRRSLLRGRPIGVDARPLVAGSRIALVETLRAAAPWQALRRADVAARGQPRPIILRREDFRIQRFAECSESTVVFCVDASGSAAFHRLAESKGAVELLLAQAYASRTQAALVVFRGSRAGLLLPPTRSLSRAKSLLASLPGGGGTPLAAGVDLAILTAMSERAKGREPLIIILSDGRANIARDGTASRQRASEEALAAARALGAQRIEAVFVDTSPRPGDAARDLAQAMKARYVALPYVDAASVRDVVTKALPTSGSAARRGR